MKPSGSNFPADRLTEKTWNLRYGHTNRSTDDFTLKGHVPYAQSIEKATNNRVKITLSGTEDRLKSGLSNEQIWSEVKSGSTDIGWLYTGLYPGQFSYIEVSTLPFLYPSAGIGSQVTWQIFTSYPEIQSQFRDVKVLAIWITEPYFIAGKSQFYKTIPDFKGQIIRAGGGPPSAFVKALGASTVMVTRTEINQAFEKNVIDAALLPAEAYLAFKTYMVAPYITRVSTVATVNALVMNLSLWNNFPKDIQDQIMIVSGETASVNFGHQVFDKDSDEMADIIKKSGGKIMEYVPPTEEINKWIEKSGKPVWNAWVKAQEEAGLINAQQILDDVLDRSRPK
jgi:TRAP-type transport system periplasmic protein